MAILETAEFTDSIVLHVEFPQIDAVLEAVHFDYEIVEQIYLCEILQPGKRIADHGQIVVLQEQYFQIGAALVEYRLFSVRGVDSDRAELLAVHLKVVHVSQVLSVLGLPANLLWLR